jgi:hypothetical protein
MLISKGFTCERADVCTSSRRHHAIYRTISASTVVLIERTGRWRRSKRSHVVNDVVRRRYQFWFKRAVGTKDPGSSSTTIPIINTRVQRMEADTECCAVGTPDPPKVRAAHVTRRDYELRRSHQCPGFPNGDRHLRGRRVVRVM